MPKPQKIAVLLFPDFSNHCLANAVEPLRAANGLVGQELYSWEFLSLDGAIVQSSSGLEVTPNARLSDHPGGDLLFIIPSYGHLEHAAPAAFAALRAASARFEMLAGLDTGAWLMAAAGLLDRKKATIHWDELGAMEETFPDVLVTGDRFVIDGNRITSGGASTTFELMLELIKRRHGAMLSLEVAALFMFGEGELQQSRELRLPPDRIVEAAAALMRRHIEMPMPLKEIGKALNLSKRKLEMQFKEVTGKGPGGVYRTIRLREARALARRSRYSIAEIATRCGYEDASAMTRAFRREFGVSPRAVRRAADQARSAP